MWRRLNSIFTFLFRRQRVERELDGELAYHLDHQIERNLARGMSPEEARRQAAILMGGIEPLKDDCRDARLGRLVETVWQDLRYGARVLRKNPGFALAAICTLALGIGANTAIFSMVYGVLLRPLPYQQGSQLVVLHQNFTRQKIEDMAFTPLEFKDYCDRNHTLSAVVEHHLMYFLLLGKDTAERVETAVVSHNFFDVLGVQPILGRNLVAADEQQNADAVLLLSYKYWKNQQGGDPHVIGKVFQMNNRPHTVIGVLPPIPQYPSESDVYVPTTQCPFRSNPRNLLDRRRFRLLSVFARLKPGATVAEAQADLSVASSRIAGDYPDVYPRQNGYALGVVSLRDDLTRRARTTLLVLLGGAGFVLLIACANVANLLLARLLKLERELAVRAALGASRMRLLRQSLTESLLLSLAGGALGLMLAPAALALLVRFAERYTTRAAEVRMDTPVLLFALLISMATGILFGLAPALSTGRWMGEAFKQAGSRTTSSRLRQRLRGGLVIAQVAVSCILLTGAGLMMRSFVKLQQASPGFNPARLLSLRLSTPFPRYDQNNIPMLRDRVLADVKAISGVESAALTSVVPFDRDGIVSGPGINEFEIEGRPASRGEVAPVVDVSIVSSEYFDTIHQPLVAGRGFTDHDDAKAPTVFVINQTMARHRWPNEDPVGKRISFDRGQHWGQIVGVVSDVNEYGLSRPVADEVYGTVRQNGGTNRLVVRTSADPRIAASAVRTAIRHIDPQIAVDHVDSVENLEYDSMASPRVMTFLLGIFAGLALFISASGLAAVMALAVSQRTNEIGIRMALGARDGSIIGMVVRQGIGLALAGAALGMAGAAALTRLLSTFLYGTSPTDVATFAGVALLFLAVAAVASFVPARQVAAIDPVIALRQE